MISAQRIWKILKTLAIIAGVFLIISLLCFFIFRNSLLQKTIEKIATKVNHDYNATLTINQAKFTGIASVELSQIALVPHNHDSVLYIDKIETGVKLGYALLLDIRLDKLEINRGYVNLINDERGRNIDGFLHPNAVKNQSAGAKTNSSMAKSAYKLISKVLNFIPSNLVVNQFALNINDKKQHVNFTLKQLEIQNQKLSSTINVTSWFDTTTINRFEQNWQITGTTLLNQKMADVRFYNLDTTKVLMPYLKDKFNLTTGFDSIRLKLDGVELADNELTVKGLASTTNFLVNHPKIAKTDVIIEKAEFNYVFKVGSNYFSLDSSSQFKFNQVTINPFVKYQRGPDTTYQLNVVIANTKAQDFINSLPSGLFNHFKGMEAEGSFSYRLDFLYNENKPQALVFDSKLEKSGLKITKYGEANLAKLNTDFTYNAIENGRVVRNIDVSATNPNFTGLPQVSPYLVKSVLTTEDPSFFYHRGFIDEAFRQSIIKNIRKRKFARGASTISMQLVKNVFLTREKTLSRKLEEILLVYILENNRLSSKERMFEVYLNVIEWGPNVYGIAEASRFYFNKQPSELTLSEALYLAIIIPSPKKFMWRFGKNGELKEHVGRHFKSLAGLMIRRNVLLPEDTIGLTHKITITGPAKSFIKITADTVVTDSILFDENGLLINEELE